MDKADLQKLSGDWLERIRKQVKIRDDGWGKDAEAAEKAYSSDAKSDHGKLMDFNIVFANTETTIPAVFNSQPTPDIRERFSQGDDVARDAADALERIISVQIDDGALQVEVEDVVRDGEVAGRGIVRLKLEVDGPEENQEQRVEYESVAWRDYVEGPAKRFEDLPWIAYRYLLDRDEVERLSDKELTTTQYDPAIEADEPDEVTIWEVWCKRKREVIFIREDDGKVIKIAPDPLGLKGFFPNPKPYQPLSMTGKRAPIVPFTAYKKLADELNLITGRINRITAGLKVRAALITGAEDIARLSEAEDNEIVPIADLEGLGQLGFDRAVLWWPIEHAIAVLRELYLNREQTKQAIYEVTGISDIVRGATRSGTTATENQIKTQWGSLRIKRRQSMVERLIRDLFVMTAELIGSTFTPNTMMKASGMELDPKQLALISSPTAHYRINVESDSTIRADLGRVKTEMSEFLNGTAQFFATMAPIVQQTPQATVPMVALYGSFARQYNLGRQAEDALDELMKMAQEAAEQPQEQSGEQQAAQAEMQQKMAAFQHTAQMDAARLQMDQQKTGIDMQLRQQDLALKAQDRELKAVEIELKRHELALKGEQMEFDRAKDVAEVEIEISQQRAAAIGNA